MNGPHPRNQTLGVEFKMKVNSQILSSTKHSKGAQRSTQRLEISPLANRMLQRDSRIGELFMYFKPFRDPLYKVSLLSFQREVLRFAEPLEVVDGQLSSNCKEALNHFTTNVP